MKRHFCIPQLKQTRGGPKSRRFTQSTLLERFREAVLRLIMLSALNNKASSSSRTATTSTSWSSPSPRSGCQRQQQEKNNYNYYNYARMSTHQSEAVADCIEFIKKKSFTITTTSICDASSSSSAELEIIRPPLPVM